jgi:cysteine desulfurase
MRQILKSNFGNPASSHRLGIIAHKTIEQARKKIATIINAEPDEIIFTSGGTESDNLALNGAKILFTSTIEHKAVMNKAFDLQRNGAKIHFLPVNNLGIINNKILEEKINQKRGLVSIMFANNEIGTIQNIKELAKIAHKNNCLFHTDAVQAVGHIRINVKDIGVDLLSASAHKFGGTKGIGFLYVKKGTKITPLLFGGHQENKMRAGTENVAGIVGMATALEWQIQNMERNTKKILKLEQTFISKILAICPEVKFNGCEGNKLSGLISMTLPRSNSEGLLHLLDLKGICISSGAACNSKKDIYSHVLRAIGLSSIENKGTLRISFGYNNTLKDIEFIWQSIKKLITDLG